MPEVVRGAGEYIAIGSPATPIAFAAAEEGSMPSGMLRLPPQAYSPSPASLGPRASRCSCAYLLARYVLSRMSTLHLVVVQHSWLVGGTYRPRGWIYPGSLALTVVSL